jgi:hypothetical protein
MNDIVYYQTDAQVKDHQDMLAREAAQWRLAQETAESNKPVYGPALAQAGKLLVEIGSQLQGRYGKAVEAVDLYPPQPADPRAGMRA